MPNNANLSSSKALREKRAPLATRIRELADRANKEAREFTAEEQEQWTRVNEDYDSMTRQIERAERADAVESDQRERLGRMPPGARNGIQSSNDNIDRLRTLALGAWCSSQFGCDLTEEQTEACQVLGFNPNARHLDIPLYRTADTQRLARRYREVHYTRAADHCADFRAALTTGSGPGGGYLIPPEMMLRQIEINMLAFGGVRQVADTIRTASGERISWPTADDTSNTGVQLGESASIGSSVDPTFGKVYWDAYKFSSKPILVPYELLQDNAFDLPGLIGQFFGERLGRITNTKFTTGTGAATPKGIVTAATTYSAASASAISFDDLLNLEHSIDPAYRVGASYMLHDAILLTIRKLKDGQGLYLWQSDPTSGRPDTIHGYPLTVNQDMDSTISSGKKTVLFGQMSKYKIRTVGLLRAYRLEERYRDTDQDGFVAFTREDGNLLTAGTAPVKVLTH